MYALTVRVRGAGVFGDPRYSSDFVMDADGMNKRSGVKKSHVPPQARLKVPAGKLGVPQVANLIRVLFGQRPVPSRRRVLFTGDQRFEELARKVRVQMLSPVSERGYYPAETLTVRKSVSNAWNTVTLDYLLDGKYVSIKGGVLYWDRIRRHLGEELYQDFLNVVGKFGKVITVRQAVELLNVHKNTSEVREFCERLRKAKRTSLSNLILNDNPASVSFQQDGNPLCCYMVNSGVEQVQRFDAVLFIPVTEDQLKEVEQGTGAATFLEGGVVSILGVDDWSSELINAQTESTVEGEVENVSDQDASDNR